MLFFKEAGCNPKGNTNKSARSVATNSMKCIWADTRSIGTTQGGQFPGAPWEVDLLPAQKWALLLLPSVHESFSPCP